jgi:hypothetical protein
MAKFKSKWNWKSATGLKDCFVKFNSLNLMLLNFIEQTKTI